MQVLSALLAIGLLLTGVVLFSVLAVGFVGVLLLDVIGGKNEPFIGAALFAAIACAAVAGACAFLIVEGARDRRERMASARPPRRACGRPATHDALVSQSVRRAA